MPTLTDITSSFITDAEGHWHDLSKGAFDAFTLRQPGKPAAVSKDLFNQPLQAIAQKLKDTVFEKAEQYSKTVAAGTGAAALTAITKIGAEIAGAEALGALVSGPVGAVLGVLMEVGYEWYESFQDDGQEAYKQGQWVILNLGMKPKQLKDDYYPMEFLGGMEMDGIYRSGSTSVSRPRWVS